MRIPPAVSISFRAITTNTMSAYKTGVREFLENSIAAYSALTKGTCIEIEYNGIKHKLLIEDIEPAPVACVINTDVIVDLLPAVDSEGKIMVNSSENVSRTIAVGQTEQLTIMQGDWAYWKIFLAETGCYQWLCQTGIDEDVEIYATLSEVQPTRNNHDFSCNEGQYMMGGLILFKVHKAGIYSFAVKSRSNKASITIQCSLILEISSSNSVSATNSDSTATGENKNKDNTVCKHCAKEVPTISSVRHAAFCVRNNLLCSICSEVYKIGTLHQHCDQCSFIAKVPRSFVKHNEIFHAPLPCSCGELVTLINMKYHRENICPDRLIFCKFCENTVRAGLPCGDYVDREYGLVCEHESICGSHTKRYFSSMTTCYLSLKLYLIFSI